MSPRPHLSISSQQLNALIDGAVLLVVDFDGALSRSTELVQQISLTRLINEETGSNHSIYDIAGQMAGKTLPNIVSIIKSEYNIQGTSADLLKRQADMYLDIAIRNDVKPHQDVVAALSRAKELQIPRVILSNGNESTISTLITHWKIGSLFHSKNWKKRDISLHSQYGTTELMPKGEDPSTDSGSSSYWKTDRLLQLRDWGHPENLNGIYASDSPRRLKVSNKTEFLFCLSEKHTLPLSKVIVIEDNPETLRHMKENLGIKEVYVKHELNDPYTPNTGIVLDGHSPDLCGQYRALLAPERRRGPTDKAPFASFSLQ